MFSVKYKNNKLVDGEQVVKVFDIKNNKNGYPHFLIYYNKQWKYVSAKYFVPLLSVT